MVTKKILIVSLFFPQIILAHPTEYLEKIARLRKEIQLLNLINALELSEKQITYILRKAEEVQKAKIEFAQEIEKRHSQIVKVLTTVRNTLVENKPLSQKLKKEVHKIERQFKQIKKYVYGERISNIISQVEEVLSPHQLYIIDRYIPCLVPPKEGTAGRVEPSNNIERSLQKIRELPLPTFERRKEKIAELAIEHIKLHSPSRSIDKKKEKQWIVSFLEEIYSLSPLDFALRKNEYARKLKKRYTSPKIAVDTWSKIETFLTTPELIPLLQEKIKSLQ